jgi:hypothetical protein
MNGIFLPKGEGYKRGTKGVHFSAKGVQKGYKRGTKGVQKGYNAQVADFKGKGVMVGWGVSAPEREGAQMPYCYRNCAWGSMVSHYTFSVMG